MNHNEVDATFVALYGAEQADTPVVLGLDLGSSFGWCIVTEGEITESGWYPTTIKGEGGGMHLLRFKTYLTSIINEYKPGAVFYETVPFQKGRGREIILRQTGILELELTDRGLPYGAVHVSTLKKFATGSGRASKDQMRAALFARDDFWMPPNGVPS